MTLFVSLALSVVVIIFLIGGLNEVFWFALAVGTIGGVAVSLLFVLVIFPSFLLIEKELCD